MIGFASGSMIFTKVATFHDKKIKEVKKIMRLSTKKLIAMGLAVVLTVGSLTGCGGDTPESGNDDANANATIQVTIQRSRQIRQLI